MFRTFFYEVFTLDFLVVYHLLYRYYIGAEFKIRILLAVPTSRILLFLFLVPVLHLNPQVLFLVLLSVPIYDICLDLANETRV